MSGKPIEAEYHGLADKSVAIVIYADQATTNEFPAAREEISSFLAGEMRDHIPTARLLDYHEVTNWQDDTINWFGLTEKQMGQHFGVDRVIYIEMLDYAVIQEKGVGDLQGHIRANCKVFEVDSPTAAPAWSEVIDVSYPEDRPIDASQTTPDAVRSHTLQKFTETLVERFYDHHEIEKNLNERE
jgi:hypothetical protein